MKKALLILVSIALLIAGGIVLTYGIIHYDKNSNLTTKTQLIEESFSNFAIDLSISDLEFKLSDDASVKVVCTEKEKQYHTITVQDDTLCIKSIDERKWYEKLFNWDSQSVVIYLPAGNYNELNIASATGDVTIPHDFTFKNANLKLSTGNTEISANIEETLKINSATGNVKLRDATFKNLDVKVSTANVIMANVLVDEHIEIKTSTGNVKFEAIDAGSLNIKTATGNVYGTILTDKVFSATSSTGNVNVPSLTTGGACKIETSTGNISVSIK